MTKRKPLDVSEVPLHGVQLIEASAGTGKTYTITSLVLRLLTETPLTIDRVLAVTFTNAATAELAERLRARLGLAVTALASETPVEGDDIIQGLLRRSDRNRMKTRLEAALGEVDRAGISTIHGFASRVLSLHAFEAGLLEEVELSGDDRARVFDVVTDFWSSEVATLSPATFAYVASMFPKFTSLAKLVSGAFEVPLVPEHPPEVDRAALDELAKRREASLACVARALSTDGPRVLELLCRHSGLNQRTYKPERLRKLFPALVDYFRFGGGEYPSEAGLFTTEGLAAGVNKGKLPPRDPLFDLLGEHHDIEVRLRALAEPLGVWLQHRLAADLPARLGREHRALRSRSFDGLLSELCLLLRRPGLGERMRRSLRSRFGVALIDEFQDTDKLQYEIFQRLFGEGEDARLFLIGDPKQSIYAFRGADVHAYLAAADSAPLGAHTLGTSFRSSPAVVAAQNALLSGPPHPFGLEGIVYEPVLARSGAENLLVGADGEALPGMVLVESPDSPPAALALAADQAVELLSSGARIGGRDVSPKDIAILTRTNREAQEIQRLLARRGVVAVMHGDRSVFESDEAVELRRILRAVAEPGRRVLLRTALCTRFVGLDSRTLASFEQDTDLLESWTLAFRDFGTLWQARGITACLEALSERVDLLARSLREVDGPRRVTNFRHLLELLHEAETSEHLGLFGLLRWFDSATSSPTGHEMAAEARQIRLESDSDAVTLTTVHKSKGLEYGIVILPQVGTSNLTRKPHAPYRYHDAARGEPCISLTSGVHDEARVREDAEENLRLAYVGLTRAKHQTIVLHAPDRPSALAYFLTERRPGPESPLLSGGKLDEHARDGWQREVARLVRETNGALRHCPLESRPRARSLARRGSALPGPRLVPPPEPRAPTSHTRTSSFSGMTRLSAHRLSRAAKEGRDVDEVDEVSARATDQVGIGPAPAGRDEGAPERILLHAFPRGAGPGNVIHQVFERLPFAEGTSEERFAVVERELALSALSPELAQGLASTIERVLAAPLPTPRGGAFRLGQLDRAARFSEMEFSMPVGDGGGPLSPGRLASVLRRTKDPAGPFSPAYVEAVGRLEFSAWSGFLRGFMDLVVYVDGALHVLDYKSNHLGEFDEDYDRSHMQEAMEEHHYLLQALLYAVAVHRHGQVTLPAYDYDEHFGGVHYLFVRGMKADGTTGAFSFRPPKALVVELSDALRGGSEP